MEEQIRKGLHQRKYNEIRKEKIFFKEKKCLEKFGHLAAEN